MLGSTVSHFRIIEELGSGGMGVVYLAQDTRLGRKVALKFLSADRNADVTARSRFTQEAMAASALNHPGICTIHDIGESKDGRLYIAMAHYEGRTVRELLESGPLEIDIATRIVSQVAGALAKAHAAGITHRDIKPGNILVTEDGQAVILDWGIAKLGRSSGLTETDQLLGTAGYMSPEQLRGHEVGSPSDVWSLAVVCYEMLAGRRPFDAAHRHAEMFSILNQDPRDVREFRPEVPAELAGFLERCLVRVPDERPKIAEFAVGLRSAKSEDVASASPVDSEPTLTSGTVTLFFSDLEGSTRLLDQLGSLYGNVLGRIRSITREELARHRGAEVDTAGDGLFASFRTAGDAVRAAIAIQLVIARQNWPRDATVGLRIGIHTGEPEWNEGILVGMDVHRAARICAAAHGGQILISAVSEALIRDTLDHEVKLFDIGEYRLKDIPKPERLYQVVVDGLARDFAPPHTDEAGGILPSTASELIGRDTELSELIDLLRDGARLVTLTGPGGTGKTRLAIEAARQAQEFFEHGVYFVGLAPVNDPDLLLSVVARELGVQENPNRPIGDTLAEHLGSRRLLLLLDNFEQLVDAAPRVPGLLSSAPGVSILITSRVALRVRGENEYRVPTLPFPDELPGGDTSELARYPAVRLFVERARSVRPGFELSGNEELIAAICRRLDGLPLAIELAAARSRLFTPATLLRRLDRSLDVLQTRARDMPDRHQTLRGAISWSYEMLDDDEKRLFSRLSVFSGGWTIPALTEIGGVDSAASTVETALESLMEHSLVRERDPVRGEARFGMLETIREFAAERLAESGSEPSLRARHADYFSRFAAQGDAHLTGADQDEWLDRLEAEHDNFRAALRWSLEHESVDTGLMLGSSLWRFWAIRGYMIQGRHWLERLLALPGADAPTRARAHALNALATILHEIGHYTDAGALLVESLAIFRHEQDEGGCALVLNNIGWVACEMGQYETARARSLEAFELHERLGNRRGQALALNNMAWAATYESRLSEARELQEKAVEIRKEIEDERGVAFGLINIGWVERLMARIDIAIEKFDRALSILERLRDPQLQAFGVGMRATAVWDAGDVEAAEPALRKSLDYWKQSGNKWGTAWAHCTLALVLSDLGRADDALWHAEQGRRDAEETESGWGLGLSMHAMGAALCANGRYDEARPMLAGALERRQWVHDLLGMAEVLEEIAFRVVWERDRDQVGVLLAAAIEIRETIGAPPPIRLRGRYQSAEVALSETSIRDRESLDLDAIVSRAVNYLTEPAS